MMLKDGDIADEIDPICHQHLQFVNKIYWHKFIRRQYQCHPRNDFGWISNQNIVFSKFCRILVSLVHQKFLKKIEKFYSDIETRDREYSFSVSLLKTIN